MMWGYPMYGYGFEGLFSLLWFILVVVVVAMVIRFAFFGPRRMHGMRHMGHSSALDIVEERYAKGEINKQEYEEKKKDLLG